VLDLGWETGSRESEEDNSGMSQFLLENKFAEIAIGNDEDTSLIPGDFKDILIWNSVRVVAGDCLNVVSELG
jgi:hypothetical protein